MSPRRANLVQLVISICLAVPVGCGGLDGPDVVQQDQGNPEISLLCNGDEECDNGEPCQSGSCDPDGQCIYTPLIDVPCDDGNVCTDVDTCNEDGVCVGAETLMCHDSNDCTSDTCDNELGCVFVPRANGDQCEDGSGCSLDDYCQNGECTGGTIVDCQDDNVDDCFFPACDPLTGVCERIEQQPVGHPCKDGNPCTDDDSCDESGTCQPGDTHDCTPQNPCKKAWCNETAKEGTNPCILEWKVSGVGCDDGDACTESDKCLQVDTGPALSCQGAVINCDDSDPCTADSCNPDLGCVFLPKTDGTPCAENLHWKCLQGTCTCVPSCIDKECGSDGCGGTCGDCDVSASCVAGKCACPYEKCDGTCCDFGQVCAGGGCCTTNCAGKECGPDGCGGVCGECPGPQYDCQGGQCVCVPSCVGQQCGGDGCGGSCGECTDPLADCLQGVCECPYENCGGVCCLGGQACHGEECCTPQCAAKNCGDDGCGGSCGTCPGVQYECQFGICVCLPSCVGKECGDNGCGGSCGGCGPSEQCTNGECSCKYANCGNTCCSQGQTCYLGSCCSPSCSGKECGADGCGGSCGQCPGAQYQCNNGKCLCTPNCSGKECGPDGCGGQCGTCGQYAHCSGGNCVCDDTACGIACCAPGQTCFQGQCCAPSCWGKECGSDGCGGQCGTCGADSSCQNGQCVCSFQQCGGTCCGGNQDCNGGVCCSPSCAGKGCGDSDGCGGYCQGSKPGMACIPSLGVYIDKYEASEGNGGEALSVAGAWSWDWVDWWAAKEACEKAGKRLCTLQEWQAGCKGPSNAKYPYGSSYQPTACAVYDYCCDTPNGSCPFGCCITTGELDGCEGGYPGLFDMVGCVAEWTADCYGSGWNKMCKVAGGDFTGDAQEATCSTVSEYHAGNDGQFVVGFRCCDDP